MEQQAGGGIKKDFVDMAHRVDMSEEFKTLFNSHALGVGESKNRNQRVTNLTVLFWDLNTYKKTLGFEDTEIDVVRVRKLIERGKFDNAAVQVSQDGTSKLVRDKIPDLFTQDESGQPYTYKTAGVNERLLRLDQKLIEECEELLHVAVYDEEGNELPSDKVHSARLKELADISEVLAAIMRFRNIQMNEITPRLQTLETVQVMEKRRKLKNLKN